jgi:hypothetical protein
MPADVTSSRCAQNTVMNGIVPGEAPDDGALEAAFGVSEASARDESGTDRSDFEQRSWTAHAKASDAC